MWFAPSITATYGSSESTWKDLYSSFIDQLKRQFNSPNSIGRRKHRCCPLTSSRPGRHLAVLDGATMQTNDPTDITSGVEPAKPNSLSTVSPLATGGVGPPVLVPINAAADEQSSENNQSDAASKPAPDEAVAGKAEETSPLAPNDKSKYCSDSARPNGCSSSSKSNRVRNTRRKRARALSKRSRKRNDSSIPASELDSACDSEQTSGAGALSKNGVGNGASGSESLSHTDQRYSPISELGRGGWGVVERAVDHQLQREVAVKRLGSEIENDNEIRNRFFHEARVTSQLQHPGIVPVHELGLGTGNTYYVMKLLEGKSLREHIREAHQSLAGRQKFSANDLRETYLPLLNRFVDICNAIAYAHRRGVIHRDLKPANVMVGEFGETIVVDWGLAKHVETEGSSPISDSTVQSTTMSKKSPAEHHEQDAYETASVQYAGGEAREDFHEVGITHCRTGETSGQGASNVSIGSDTYEVTCQGSVIGTPAYMPPEQASGNIALLSPQSDIYSLGVILFEIVCGKAPLSGCGVEQILKRVQIGDVPTLRDKQPRVPKALEAICSTAMSLKPSDRYHSAEQLANDIRSYIAGDRVSVYRDPILDRVARWCRKNQSLAFAIATAGSVVLIASVIFGGIIRRAHRAEQVARKDAVAAHRNALDQLAVARDSADSWLVDLSGALQHYPGLEPLREHLIAQAMSQYEKLASDNPDEGQSASDPLVSAQILLEQARADIRLGDLLRLQESSRARVGEAPAGQSVAERYMRAHDKLTRAKSLCSQYGDSSSAQSIKDSIRLEQANVQIGLLLADAAHNPRQNTSHASTLQWLVTYLPEFPAGDLETQLPLTTSRREHVSAYIRLNLALARAIPPHGRGQAAEYLRLASTWSHWLADNGGKPSDYSLAETATTDWAEVLHSVGKIAESIEVRDELVQSLDRWIVKSPRRADLLQSAAYTKMNQAQQYAQLHETRRAELLYESAIADLKSAWSLLDADSVFQLNVATANHNLAQLVASSARTDPSEIENAKGRLQQSIAIYERLLQQQVTEENLRRLSESHAAMASLLRKQDGREADQGRHWESACLGYQMLVDHQLANYFDLTGYADALVGRGRLEFGNKHYEASMEHLGHAGELLNESERSQRQLDKEITRHTTGYTARLQTQLQRLELLKQLAAARGQDVQFTQAASEYQQLLREAVEEEVRGEGDAAYPFATINWIDHITKVPQPRPVLREALRWLSEIEKLYPICTQSEKWTQRAQLLRELLNRGSTGESREIPQVP